MNASTQPMNKKVVAIHQPNFFPWLGYFDKIVRSDVFIFLDDVQFPKKGGTWINRVNILINGSPRWMTATVDRSYSGFRNINEMSFNPTLAQWRDGMQKSIEQSYRKHEFFDEVMPIVEKLLQNHDNNVAEYNINAIMNIASLLDIDLSKFKSSSQIPSINRSTDLLCELTLAVGGSVYMCGGGANGYQNDSVFDEKGLILRYQKFLHPVYSQRGSSEFVPGLSIIDALMNLGVRGVAELLKRSE
jgi:hypothetical protein